MATINEIAQHHSLVLHRRHPAPAPLFISNGFTDDLFPPDEALRFYNRTRLRHPATPLKLMFFDFGHQRGQAKPDGTARLRDAPSRRGSTTTSRATAPRPPRTSRR